MNFNFKKIHETWPLMKKEMNVKVYEENVRGNVPYGTIILLFLNQNLNQL